MELNILVGNVGSGKSTIARKLAHLGNAVVNMDSIQESISGGIYGAYDPEKKKIYQKIEDTTIEETLKSGMSVCIDRTNMDKKRRSRFIEIGKKYTNNIKCFDFGCGTDEMLKRRLKDTRGVPEKTWYKVFESMRESYEKPDTSEGFSEIIIPPERYEFHAFDFDGTIVENKFPEIGNIINGTVQKINDLYKEIKNIIIIWTCRGGEFEAYMRNFLLKKRIPFDFINENPIFENTGRKIFAHKYYDDRNEPF